MSDLLYEMQINLSKVWNEYVDILIKAQQMLQEKKDIFKEILLRDFELLKQEKKEFGKNWEEYKKIESNNDMLTSSGSYKTLYSD